MRGFLHIAMALLVVASLASARACGAEPVAPERVEKLIRQLESNRFPERAQAARELDDLGQSALPAIKRILADKPNLDLRRRLEMITDSIQNRDPIYVRQRLDEAAAARAETLIALLNSDQFVVREKANAELETIGAPALGALRKATTQGTDPVVRQRAQALIHKIGAL